MSRTSGQAALEPPVQKAAKLATDAMLDAIPGFAAVLDARGTIVSVNNAWRRTPGDSRFAEIGTNYLRVLERHVAEGVRDADALIASLEKVLSSKVMNVVTDHAWPAQGATQRWTFVVQRFDRRGGVLVIHRPILAEHQAAELGALGAASDRVVQLAIAGELLHAITHDLRQPLAALRLNLAAALELARRRVPEATDVAESLADALEQEERVSHKLAFVDDLVASRPPTNEPVDLSDLAEEVVRVAKTEAIARRVPFQSRLSSDLPTIVGDRHLIRAAILGLVLDALGALNGAAPARVGLTTRRVGSDQVEVAVCRFADDAAPSADWILTIARAVADVDSAAIIVDANAKARSCVRMRWRIEN